MDDNKDIGYNFQHIGLMIVEESWYEYVPVTKEEVRQMIEFLTTIETSD